MKTLIVLSLLIVILITLFFSSATVSEGYTNPPHTSIPVNPPMTAAPHPIPPHTQVNTAIPVNPPMPAAPHPIPQVNPMASLNAAVTQLKPLQTKYEAIMNKINANPSQTVTYKQHMQGLFHALLAEKVIQANIGAIVSNSQHNLNEIAHKYGNVLHKNDVTSISQMVNTFPYQNIHKVINAQANQLSQNFINTIHK